MDDPAFLTDTTIDINTQTILLHASNHDIAALKPLLRIPGNASVQDPETGFTPLHAAIAACGSYIPADAPKPISAGKEGEKGEEDDEGVDIEKAKDTLRELFLGGAIWNDLDANDETPGCLAWRLGQKELYEMCVDAGVRAEVLLGLMGGYEELGDEDSEDEDAMEILEDGTVAVAEGETACTNGETITTGAGENTEPKPKKDVNSADYLASDLTFTSNALLDADANGVMMSWETEIMRRSVDLLLPSLSPASTDANNEANSPPPNPTQPGPRILNIGFGMGIIDSMFAAHSPRPSVHHIIEVHPGVLSKIAEPNSPFNFGAAWEASAPSSPSPSTIPRYHVFAGKWQDVLLELLQAGEIYDAIYFDTFGESYTQLKFFFSEFIPGLLDEGGRFGFFNGLGADRRVCYDVYTKVVEVDLEEAGLEVSWEVVRVGEIGEEGKGEWEGVRRRYWVLDEYRLPVIRFLG